MILVIHLLRFKLEQEQEKRFVKAANTCSTNLANFRVLISQVFRSMQEHGIIQLCFVWVYLMIIVTSLLKPINPVWVNILNSVETVGLSVNV